jgi:N-acetylglucosaminyldiphosphoundecaprenol N-acetyl-beta-D-mannosaminyltransferase
MADSLLRVENWIESGSTAYICVTGVHGVMESQKDAQLARIHNESGLTVPDGRPMTWCGRFAGAREIRQVRGIDLTLELARLAEAHQWPIFLYGGAVGTAELMAQKLSDQFPRLKVAGVYAPPFRHLSAGEDAEVISCINRTGAKIIFVGLSTPKQERWMAEHLGRLEASVLVGVGAAFDVHAGLARTAPRWTSPLGLEWLYRLTREPRRLWRRYIFNNPRFVAKILMRRPYLRADETCASFPDM